MKIKIMEYNVKQGFCEIKYVDGRKDYQFIKSKKTAAQKVVKKENPDILCLTEASFAKHNYRGIFHDYKKIFNFPYIDIRKDVALLSKFPISFAEGIYSSIYPSSGAGISSQIKIGKKVLYLDIIHPAYNVSDEKRIDFVRPIIERMKKPYILTGDFNSLSPKDKYDNEFMKNFATKVLRTENSKYVVEEMVKGKLLEFMMGRGLIDTYLVKNKDFDFTIPTDLLSKDKSTGIRIDYILCSQDIKVVDSGIIKNKDTEKGSDHYPIYAILEIK